MPSCAHWRNAHCGSAPLACDGALVRILTTGDGQVLDVRRKTRVIPPAVRRGLKVRDRGCRFLCRHHHRLLHEGGYYVVRDRPRFIFCKGDGELVQSGFV